MPKFTKTTAIKPMLIKGITRAPGFVICPAELLINTQQELHRGRLAELEPFVESKTVWATLIKNVPTLFKGVTFEFIQDWAKLLYSMEQANPRYTGTEYVPATEEEAAIEATTPGRPTVLKAIKDEALRRRELKYHNDN